MFTWHMPEKQWRKAVIVTGCALFVMSHCDVKFTFQIQRFGKGFDTLPIIIYALSSFIVV